MDEAVAYTGLGRHVLIALTNEPTQILCYGRDESVYTNGEGFKNLLTELIQYERRIFMDHDRKAELVPMDKKCVLNIHEAMLYSGLTQQKLIELSQDSNLDIVLWIGRNRLFKRTKLEEYLDNQIPNELMERRV